mgnify:CR=1 FL=1
MTPEEIAVTLTKCKEEIGSLKHRMSGVEDMTKSINNLALSVQELTLNMKHMLDHQEEHEERIVKLEKVPAEKWKSVESSIITGIIGTVLGIVLGALFN